MPGVSGANSDTYYADTDWSTISNSGNGWIANGITPAAKLEIVQGRPERFQANAPIPR